MVEASRRDFFRGAAVVAATAAVAGCVSGGGRCCAKAACGGAAPADAGTIDYLSVIRTLKDIGYSGACGLELRNAYLKPSAMNPGADPVWIPRSIGYFRGLMAAV